jgi:putative membrane protein
MPMQQTRTFTDKFLLVLKGLAMGAANKVPGVSGGVVAFVAGFYEEFIYSLQKVNLKAFKLLISGRFRSLYHYINGKFLLLLILGMLISYFTVSKILDYLIIHYELYVWSAFFGMIIGSIYYISKDFEDWDRNSIVFAVLGIIAGIAISFLEPARENDNLWFVFICGMISVSGMTLPGLSGSFILILVGNYVLLLVDSVNALYDTMADILMMDFSWTGNAERIQMLKVLAVFAIGSLAGLVSLSHLLGYVLKTRKRETFAVIIGFITGSLGVVWPWKEKVYKIGEQGKVLIDRNGNKVIDNYDRYWPQFDQVETFAAIFCIGIGISIVLALAWYEKITSEK